MSLLSGLANLAADIPGARNLVSAAIHPFAPGTAANIVNPNVNFLGASNPSTSSSSAPPVTLGASTYATQQGLTPDYSQSGGTGSSGSYTVPAVNPNQSYIDLINGALSRLPGQLQTAQNQVQQGYDTNLNQLNSGQAQAQQNYGQSSNQNSQQFVSNKNQINNEASNGLSSLLRILGQHGAGGSSAAQYAAPNAVGQVAAQQRAGAGQTFGQNQQALDTNWNSYLSGVDNSKKQLNDWLGQQQQAAQSQSEQTKQSLLQQLVGLQPSVAAAQPLVDQINQSASKVDQLANFNPQYTGTTPVYTAPDVASYTVNALGTPVIGTPGSNNTAANPSTLSFLLGLGQKDKNQLQPSF